MKNFVSFSQLLAAAILPFLLSTACNQSSKPSGPPVSPAAQKEASEIFATRCTTCHGSTGRGDGPASAGLTPKPRNFGDKTWQSSVTDEHIRKIIEYGGAAVGKSPAMPPNPDLMAKPEIIAALQQHVRKLGQ